MRFLVGTAGLAKVLGFEVIDSLPRGDDDYEVATFRIQARLKRVGGESKLILHAGGQEPPASQQSPALIEAIVLAHAWSKASFADSSLTTDRIAVNAGLSNRYVVRIMRLAYLAPDITQAILDGTQPHRLSLRRLLAGVPLSWSEQRATFGFQRR